MIPLRDNLERRRFPVLTVALIAALIAFRGTDLVDAGWAQVVLSAGFLWIFATTVEDSMSPWRFAAFVVPVVLALELLGPGGAPAVLAGAYAVLYPRARVVALSLLPFMATVLELPALAVLGAWAALDLGLIAFGPDPAAAYLAFACGLLYGAALIRPLADRVQDDSRVAVY